VSINTKNRWRVHKRSATNLHLQNAIKKYGWDNLIKEVVAFAEKDYCFNLEKQLRPNENIGWNIAQGGGCPPGFKICGDAHPARRPENIGRYSGGNNPRALKIKYKNVIYNCIKDMAKKLGLNYSTLRYRFRTDPAKWGYEKVTDK
jgi:hypothetical protein